VDHLADVLKDVARHALRRKDLEALLDEAELAGLLPQLQLVEELPGPALADRLDNRLQSLSQVRVVGKIGEDLLQRLVRLAVSLALKVEAGQLFAGFDVVRRG